VRLNGYFKEGPLEAAYITVVLSLPLLRLHRKLELLIDTGATKTTILDKDAIAIGIPIAKLTKSRQSLLGVGGHVDTYIANNALLRFRAQDNGEHVEKIEDLLVVRHDASDQHIMRLPSVLGREVSHSSSKDPSYSLAVSPSKT